MMTKRSLPIFNWFAFDDKTYHSIFEEFSRCPLELYRFRIMNAPFMEMDLFWRTLIKFYGVPSIGMDFLFLFSTHTHTYAVLRFAFANILQLCLDWLRKPIDLFHRWIHPHMDIVVPIPAHWVIGLMNDASCILLFTVWSVKLAMEMILMVLQWHSNALRE